MIARLSGTIADIGEKHLVVDVHGVGYKLFVTPDLALEAILGDERVFATYMSVRENAIDLYGFRDENERGFFELLLDVSGIGPKSALTILAMAPIEVLSRAIGTGDVGYLTKVSGIGRKTAEKIVIELRDKLRAHSSDESRASLSADSDVIEALRTLGYKDNDARDAVKQIPLTATSTNERIKEALRILGGK